ncbi:hypothetical protein CKAH01_08642 [Colletotrichum kahawae]|uniref:Uncharacterized protein n=1 Tax=Colletotrichum kahawae TaxID=34407 RepID=A0AAD9Y2I3_COLKA|nr:hypothetical protein CKAH01_08642 [Colletotrichum kahawae]
MERGGRRKTNSTDGAAGERDVSLVVRYHHAFAVMEDGKSPRLGKSRLGPLRRGEGRSRPSRTATFDDTGSPWLLREPNQASICHELSVTASTILPHTHPTAPLYDRRCGGRSYIAEDAGRDAVGRRAARESWSSRFFTRLSVASRRTLLT